MSTDSSAPLSIGEIAQRIHLIRGQRVVLDADLAAFYGETTKRFKPAGAAQPGALSGGLHVPAGRRGVRGFKVAICNLKSGRGQHRKYLPLAFTEHGAIMAATLLNSPRATELSVYAVRAFVELRGILLSNRELAVKVHQLERKVSTHERTIAELADSMGSCWQRRHRRPSARPGSCRWKRRRASRPARQRARLQPAGRFKAAVCDLKEPRWSQAVTTSRNPSSWQLRDRQGVFFLLSSYAHAAGARTRQQTRDPGYVPYRASIKLVRTSPSRLSD